MDAEQEINAIINSKEATELSMHNAIRYFLMKIISENDGCAATEQLNLTSTGGKLRLKCTTKLTNVQTEYVFEYDNNEKSTDEIKENLKAVITRLNAIMDSHSLTAKNSTAPSEFALELAKKITRRRSTGTGLLIYKHLDAYVKSEIADVDTNGIINYIFDGVFTILGITKKVDGKEHDLVHAIPYYNKQSTVHDLACNIETFIRRVECFKSECETTKSRTARFRRAATAPAAKKIKMTNNEDDE